MLFMNYLYLLFSKNDDAICMTKSAVFWMSEIRDTKEEKSYKRIPWCVTFLKLINISKPYSTALKNGNSII